MIVSLAGITVGHASADELRAFAERDDWVSERGRTVSAVVTGPMATRATGGPS